MGDKLRLTQIYLNLLNNAVKYTNPGGKISRKVQEENLSSGNVMLTCTIADTGIGMSEEFQKTMYDSFTHVSDSRIDKIQGTGLGLTIVKRMVTLMNGTIDCLSAEGRGTTFTVHIPLVAVPAETLPQPKHESAVPEPRSNLAGVHLLIAEDNDINWEIISELLTGYGLVCDRAENGRVCVDMLNAAPPDTYALVLMDVQMPVLNGRNANRALRASDRDDLRRIPIVAMTADAFAEDVQMCLDADMDAHVAKPIEIEKVLAAIRLLLSRRSNKDGHAKAMEPLPSGQSGGKGSVFCPRAAKIAAALAICSAVLYHGTGLLQGGICMADLIHIVLPEEDGWRVARIIRDAMRVSSSQYKSARWNGQVLLDGTPAHAADVVHAGQTVALIPAEAAPVYHPTPWDLPLNIPYYDDDLLVVDKQAPLASQSSQRQGDNTLENALCAWEGDPADYVYRPVNRLDKGTSGLMLVARTAHAQQLLQKQLHTPDMVREYLAVTEGMPPEDSGVIDLPIGKAEGATVRRCIAFDGKPAVTRYWVLERGKGRALVRLRLETGRTHQIRVHLSALGCPVAGDFLYGTELPEALPRRFALHSYLLTLRHPITQARLTFESPLPKELRELL